MKSGLDVIGNSPTDTIIMGTASVDGVVNFDGVTHSTLQKFRITVSTPVPGTDRAVVFEGSTDSTAVIKNSIITNTQYGIWVNSPAYPTIENNTLVAESDEQGIYIGNSATNPIVKNNIIQGYSYAGIHVVAGETAPVPVISYNDVWNNLANYVNYPDQTGINGNISADPDFADPDYHLAGSSPAINAGDPASDYANEPAPNGGRINIGAYGNNSEAAIKSTPPADFDGDGDTDLSVFKFEPWGGMWYIKDQATESWGNSASIMVPGDYDGDGDTDQAVYNDGTWYIMDQFVDNWGDSSSVPVPGDYDGDGDTDLAVLKLEPWGRMWYVKDQATESWGNSASIPVPGDYDGDGDTDHAVYNDGTWYIMDQFVDNWGDGISIPVPGDYDGDGDTDLAVFKVEPWGGMWYIKDQASHSWGNSASIPVPGDYDGDGDTDIAVYNDGTWYIKDQFVDNWGDALSYPLPAPDTNADGDPWQ